MGHAEEVEAQGHGEATEEHGGKEQAARVSLLLGHDEVKVEHAQLEDNPVRADGQVEERQESHDLDVEVLRVTAAPAQHDGVDAQRGRLAGERDFRPDERQRKHSADACHQEIDPRPDAHLPVPLESGLVLLQAALLM